MGNKFRRKQARANKGDEQLWFSWTRKTFHDQKRKREEERVQFVRLVGIMLERERSLTPPPPVAHQYEYYIYFSVWVLPLGSNHLNNSKILRKTIIPRNLHLFKYNTSSAPQKVKTDFFFFSFFFSEIIRKEMPLDSNGVGCLIRTFLRISTV